MSQTQTSFSPQELSLLSVTCKFCKTTMVFDLKAEGDPRFRPNCHACQRQFLGIPWVLERYV